MLYSSISLHLRDPFTPTDETLDNTLHHIRIDTSVIGRPVFHSCEFNGKYAGYKSWLLGVGEIWCGPSSGWLIPASLTWLQDPGWWIGGWNQCYLRTLLLWGWLVMSVFLWEILPFLPPCNVQNSDKTHLSWSRKIRLGSNRFHLCIFVKPGRMLIGPQQPFLSGWQSNRSRSWCRGSSSLSLKTARGLEKSRAKATNKLAASFSFHRWALKNFNSPGTAHGWCRGADQLGQSVAAWLYHSFIRLSLSVNTRWDHCGCSS